MRIGTIIRKWRLCSNKTLEEVSADIGISVATLSRMERGKDYDGTTVSKVLKWLLNSEENSEVFK